MGHAQTSFRHISRFHLCIVFICASQLMAVLLLLLCATQAFAQARPPRQAPPTFTPEIRIDALFTSPAAVQAGAGVTMFAGTYVRAGVVGGIGASQYGLSGRIDGFARFHLDPLRESHWAPYGGGGITTRMDQGERTKAYLLLFAGLDGPIRRGLTTSVEAGLGGGVRAGVTLRRAVAERR